MRLPPPRPIPDDAIRIEDVAAAYNLTPEVLMLLARRCELSLPRGGEGNRWWRRNTILPQMETVMARLRETMEPLGENPVSIAELATMTGYKGKSLKAWAASLPTQAKGLDGLTWYSRAEVVAATN